MEANEGTRVLVVDDDTKLRTTTRSLLLKAGFETDVAVDGIEGLEMLKASDYDVVLLDFQMPELDGIETLKRIKQFRPEVIVIMMTAFASRDNADEAIRLNAYHYVSKPFDLERAIQLINDAKAAKAAIAEMAIIGARLEVEGVPQVFDAEDPVRNTYFLINEVNQGDPSVVILGEPGSERNRFAQVIHVNSVRKTKKLITVTCRAGEDADLEVRLFGREGTASGGRREIGALEKSSGGTLLVQDLQEVEPELAHRLLEAVRTGTFTRIGSDKAHAINTRLILLLPTSSAAELGETGHLGAWAGAVLPRLALLPPLREQRDALPYILSEVLKRQAAARGKTINRFTEDALEHLVAYEWPGNLREAENVLDNALLREKGDQISTASLPGHLTAGAPAETADTYQEAMHSFERTYFKKLLEEHGGDVESVAHHARLSVEALREKLLELQVEVQE